MVDAENDTDRCQSAVFLSPSATRRQRTTFEQNILESAVTELPKQREAERKRDSKGTGKEPTKH